MNDEMVDDVMTGGMMRRTMRWRNSGMDNEVY